MPDASAHKPHRPASESSTHAQAVERIHQSPADLAPGDSTLPGDGARDLTRLGRHSLVYLVGTAASQFGSLVVFPVFTRSLGPADFGLLSLFVALQSALVSLLILGVNTALVRFYVPADAVERRRIVGAAMAYVLVSGGALCALVAALSPALAAWLWRGHSGEVSACMRVAALGVAMQLLVVVLRDLARARSRPRLYVAGNVAQMVGTAGLSVLLVPVAGLGVPGALLAYAGGSMSAVAMLAIGQHRFLTLSCHRSMLLAQLSFGIGLVPGNVGGWILNVADRFILQHFVSLYHVGLYSAAYRVGTLITVGFVLPFQTAYLPIMFRLAETDEGPSFAGRVARYYAVVGTGVTLLICAFGASLLRGLAGPQYAAAMNVIPPVTIGCLFAGAVTVFAPGVFIMNKTYIAGVIWMGAAAANVALNVALIPVYGIMGSAYATLLGYFMLAVVYVAASQRLYRLPLEAARITRLLAIAVALGAALIGLSLVSTGSFAAAAAHVLIVAAYAPLLVMSRVVTWSEVKGLVRGLRRAGPGTRSP